MIRLAAVSVACTTASSSNPLLRLAWAGIATTRAICSWMRLSCPERFVSLKSSSCAVPCTSALRLGDAAVDEAAQSSNSGANSARSRSQTSAARHESGSSTRAPGPGGGAIRRHAA